MKIIISHDVDHLYATDHLFKDLFIEKMWVRSFLALCRKQVGADTFFYRLTLLLHNRMTRMDELMDFDEAHHIPSIYFFGMDNALGLSYSQKTAAEAIRRVLDRGFDAGVHGINYTDPDKMRQEHDAFAALSGLSAFGIRNHYVRFDGGTFQKLEQTGYAFDSTWYNKKALDIRAPYRVGKMWEFPLHIMDMYICKHGDIEGSLERTYAAIRRAEEQGMPYCTILFHDYQFDDRFDPQMKRWYTETVRFCEEMRYPFISYRDAVAELESSGL